MKAGFGYIIGRSHAEEPDEAMRICQDVADSYVDDDIAIIAVADGKAGKNLPGAAVSAARASIDTLIAFFRDPATWHIREKAQFKETALRMLESSLEIIAGGEEYTFEELRSTISAVAVRTNGEYLAVSIGDGAILAFDQEMNPKILVAPYREDAKNHTVYTNDIDGARAHMVVRGGSLRKSQYIAFAAFTDGANALVRRMPDGVDLLRTAAACTIVGSGDEIIDKIITNISQNYSRDDVSLAVLGADTQEAFAAAKAIIKERQKRSAQEAEEEAPAEEPQETTAPAAEEQPEAPAEEQTAAPAEEPAAEPEQPAEPEETPEAPAEEKTAGEPSDDYVPTPLEATVLRAVFAEPQTAESLVKNGHVLRGRVLETVLPLIRASRIRYEDGKFFGNE